MHFARLLHLLEGRYRNCDVTLTMFGIVENERKKEKEMKKEKKKMEKKLDSLCSLVQRKTKKKI